MKVIVGISALIGMVILYLAVVHVIWCILDTYATVKRIEKRLGIEEKE